MLIFDPETPLNQEEDFINDAEMVRYRYVHWTVCDIALGTYTIDSLVILAFVIPKLIDDQLQQGVHMYPTYFSCSIDYLADSVGCSVKDDFTFRLLPVLITNLCSLLLLGADNFYRHHQPFAGMDDAAPSSSNIPLDYPSCIPIAITIKP